MNNKSEYTKTLEHLFMFILEFFMKKSDGGSVPPNPFNTKNASDYFNHIIDKSKELFNERDNQPIQAYNNFTSFNTLNNIPGGASKTSIPNIMDRLKFEEYSNNYNLSNLGGINWNNGVNMNVNQPQNPAQNLYGNLMLPQTGFSPNKDLGVGVNNLNNPNIGNIGHLGNSGLKLNKQNSNYSLPNIQGNSVHNMSNFNMNNLNSGGHSNFNLDNISNFNYNHFNSDFFDHGSQNEIKMSRKGSAFSAVPFKMEDGKNGESEFLDINKTPKTIISEKTEFPERKDSLRKTTFILKEEEKKNN